MSLLFDRLVDRGFDVGDAVLSLMGHDRGRVYVVVRVEREFVFLADGDYRSVARPKKKRNKHVRALGVKIDKTQLASLDSLTVEAEKNARIRGWLSEALAAGLKE